MLGAAHFCAYYFADTVIMGEVRGSHRFPTLTALGALGGIATFANPLEVRAPADTLLTVRTSATSDCTPEKTSKLL